MLSTLTLDEWAGKFDKIKYFSLGENERIRDRSPVGIGDLLAAKEESKAQNYKASKKRTSRLASVVYTSAF